MANEGSTLGQDPSADTGSEALPSLAFCYTHKDQEIERYCETHDCLVCAKCIIYKHNQCRHVTLMYKIGTSNPHTAVIDDIKNVTALLQKVDFLLTCRESDRNALHASVRKCRDDVDKLKEKIITQLDEAGKELDTLLECQELRLNTDIDKHVTECKHVIEVLEAQLKQLETCQSMDKSTIYIGHAKAQADIEETRQIVRKLETDLEQNRLLKYEPSEHIERCLKEVHTLGEIVERKVNVVRKYVSVNKCEHIDINAINISGCTFLPDKTLVFCDNYQRELSHFTDTFQFSSKITLPSCPCDLTAISDQEVVVTLPEERQLQFVTTAECLKLDRTVTLDRECYGIEHRNGKLYVTCRDYGRGRGEVFVLDMSGKVLSRIGRIDRRLLGTKYMFGFPNNVCVSTDGSRIYVSDWGTDTFTCLSESGQIIYQCKDVPARPRGMCVGPWDQLAVCEWSSGRVVLLGDRGQVLCELVTGEDGAVYPMYVTYRPSDGVLVVGRGKGLKVFWLKLEICR